LNICNSDVVMVQAAAELGQGRGHCTGVRVDRGLGVYIIKGA
jgi:hypothetical protein